jgi:toxin secretion/phage lysis holin
MSEIERFLPVPASIGSWIKSVAAMLLVAINQLLGGWSPTMWTLGVIMILDMITGLARAAHQHTVSSTEMGWRGIKKLLTVGLVILAAALDQVIGDGTGHVVRDALIIYYIVVEALSVVENTAACGVPYPEWLITILHQLNERKAQPLPPPKT